MESKITIDIDEQGNPYLFIKAKLTDDLRDKVLNRFLVRTGVFSRNADLSLKYDLPLVIGCNYYNEETGELHAMIEASK